jgi:hypothetical protein
LVAGLRSIDVGQETAAPAPDRVRARRAPGWLSGSLSVLACVLFGIGVLASWAGTVAYDSDTFADRSVAMLDEPEVRRELADRLTSELARAGNQNAVNFRPAFQLATEAAIDTDTFRSLFRTAVKRTHQAVVASPDDGTTGLDLSDSVTIIVSNLSLPSSAAAGQNSEGGLDDSLGDVTQRLSDLRVWSWESYAGTAALVGMGGGLVLAAIAIALSSDRRRTVRRLGWGVVATGLVLAALVPIAQVVAGSRISDGPLSRAVVAGLGDVLADLRTMGLWVAVYGFLVAAASRGGHRPLPTPARAWVRLRAWIDRRRTSTRGTVLVGVGALFGGIYLASNAQLVLTQLVMVAGIWLSYLGVAALTRLAVAVPARSASLPAEAVARHRQRRVLAAGAVGAVVVVLLGIGAYVTTSRAGTAAEAAGAPECNGEAALCDVPLNLVMYAGAHNAMSSALYPGWLFAEQTSTLTGQLDAGIRALLIDTHYGIPSTARLPGSETTVVITDRAAELATPPGETYDPAIAARAQQVAANAPPRAGAQRDVYLCHNFCEMGAVSFIDQMVAVRRWLERNPEEVVFLVIEDHTTPSDTAAALADAGLADRAWTLDGSQSMPTLGDLVDAGRNLVILAENGGPGSPDWYQPAYSWFQETPYTWRSVDQMNCGPNRGIPDNPFMLVNHWVNFSPPNPGSAASQVNNEEVLKQRIDECVQQRGVLPNIVAIDFAERGDLVRVVDAHNQDVRRTLRQLRDTGAGDVTSTTTSGTTPSTSAVETEATSSALRAPTPIGSLTGGNPDAFCARVGDIVDVMVAWAIADLSKPPTAKGLPALTYGPLARRVIGEVVRFAPTELALQLQAAVDEGDAATTALQQAGFTAADVDSLADTLFTQLTAPDGDSATAEQMITDRLDARLGRDGTVALAQAFDRDHPTSGAVFDLGDVSEAVAEESGYGCLLQAS